MTQLTDWKGRRKRKQSELIPMGLELNARNVRISMGLNVMPMGLNDKRKAFRFTVPKAKLGGVKHISNVQHSLFFYNYEIENQAPKQPVN
jgi:hypothetical protein